MNHHTDTLIHPECVQLAVESQAQVRAQLQQGLLAAAASTSPKYLYDALGSRLFEAITELPEYYPTRTEAAIFARHLPDMAAAIGQGHTLIDLGAGNCAKAAGLFQALRPSRYVAVDISIDFLMQALTSLQRQHPALPMLGLGMDFSTQLELPTDVGRGSRLFFYAGSSIGNFTAQDALSFLQQIHLACRAGQGTGGLLIGVDLVKSSAVLQAAYDDALGVTAAFNRNMLLHINTLLGSDFNIAQWQHRALFNVELSRIEMHLDALQDVTVRWDGGERRFAKGESIHTENSYKYTVESFTNLLQNAGFQSVTPWQDAHKQFCVFWAQA
ncbi:MAG TPA: L-histidine N(alpha)-methyltransferase [Burkholderiaceae bacterium]|nr:L-histidine N(alpha)-methyltransferase [Burkholderiaceae bacterium]